MDVFSLLKFWRNAGIGDPINPSDFDITDDEGSFFDLVFTHPNNIDSTIVTMDGTDLKSNKRKILPLDTTKAPKSPFRSLLGLQNKVKVKEMKCEIEEVTISSLLSRDNSLRHKLKNDHHHHHHDEHMTSKRFSKDVVHKYLNLMKPKGSKRGSEKVRFSEQSQFMFSPRKEEKLSGKITVFKEVRKHLGKSRSSSSSNAVKAGVPLTALRRDDSALQQHDGIQSAILHCKKSYNSPSQGCNVLSRSGSAPSHGSRISVDEEKRSSI